MLTGTAHQWDSPLTATVRDVPGHGWEVYDIIRTPSALGEWGVPQEPEEEGPSLEGKNTYRHEGH